MELTDTSGMLNLICGLGILVGTLGVILPFVPGLLLCWASVLVWAILAEGGTGKWVVLGICTVIALLGSILKWVLPGRDLKKRGVPALAMLAGGVLGIVGFFVVPVVGLPLGFVLGVFLAELARHKVAGPAWQATKHALRATGFSLIIDIDACLLIGAVYLGGLLILS
ncbi:DUF456 domain-containing protein [Luedemannella flava]|uniref:DUF456 domain-containing protein n=1 Tax=Luedemannella flava TaxID=349316 RepID=A0ABN2LSU7_9ACTN